jgi:hypothetical protein
VWLGASDSRIDFVKVTAYWRSFSRARTFVLFYPREEKSFDAIHHHCSRSGLQRGDGRMGHPHQRQVRPTRRGGWFSRAADHFGNLDARRCGAVPPLRGRLDLLASAHRRTRGSWPHQTAVGAAELGTGLSRLIHQLGPRREAGTSNAPALRPIRTASPTQRSPTGGSSTSTISMARATATQAT